MELGLEDEIELGLGPTLELVATLSSLFTDCNSLLLN